jgi:hypothetical protein
MICHTLDNYKPHFGMRRLSVAETQHLNAALALGENFDAVPALNRTLIHS